MHFDPRRAKLLKPGEHMLVEGCPGLRLEVATSRHTWTYRFNDPDTGRKKQVAIGQWPRMSVLDAAIQWKSLRVQRDDGTAPVTEQKAKRAARVARVAEIYSVNDLVQDYINGHLLVNRSEASAKAAQRALDGLLEEFPDFALQPAALVTRTTAFDVLDSRKAMPTAAAKLRSLLAAGWDYALDAGKLPEDAHNRWRDVMKGRLKSKGKMIGGEHVGQQRRVLSADEIATLLAWLPNMHPLGRDATQMYLWTCARGVEILAMKPEYITHERDGWWWTVPKIYTKNARSPFAVDLRVPLVGRALEIVQRRRKHVGKSGYLFEDVRQEQYMQKDFSTYIYALQPYSSKTKQRGGEGLVVPVSNWTPHNLRRTSRTMLTSLGCVDEIAEAILGHLPKGIVASYNSHSYDKERREWLIRLAEQLEKLASQDGLPALP